VRGGPAGKKLSRATAHGKTARQGPAFTPARAPAAARRTTWARAAISPFRLGQKKPSRARFDLDRRMAMDGCARVAAEQKPPRRHRLQTLAHSPLPPTPASSPPRASERAAAGGVASGATVSPLAGARIHRKVSAPPSSGITVVPRSSARRAARRQLARPLSARDPWPREVGSRHRHPERIDSGRHKKR
jgi:hypothetical protein